MPYKAGTHGENVKKFELFFFGNAEKLQVRVTHDFKGDLLKAAINDAKGIHTSVEKSGTNAISIYLAANFRKPATNIAGLRKKINDLKALFLPKNERDYVNHLPESISEIYAKDVLDELHKNPKENDLDNVSAALSTYICALTWSNIVDNSKPQAKEVLEKLKVYTDADTNAGKKLLKKIEALKELAK